MPYRTLNNYISGAVITLTPITDYKLMQSKLKVLSDYADALLNEALAPMLLLDDELAIVNANQAILQLFGVSRSEITGQQAAVFFRKHWKTEQPEFLLEECKDKRKQLNATVISKGRSGATYELDARPFFEETVSTLLIALRIYEKATEKD
jgi:two-component system CheB/CheR fusion protein